jgi:hypothetical protein
MTISKCCKLFMLSLWLYIMSPCEVSGFFEHIWNLFYFISNLSQLKIYLNHIKYVTPTFCKNKIFVQIGVHIKMHIKL